MVSLITCYKKGKDFTDAQVYRLAEQVPDIVVITNEKLKGISTLPMPNEWENWWCKMNAYNTDLIGGDILLMDLDITVFNIPKIPKETTVLKDFPNNSRINSSLLFIKEKDRKRIYADWIENSDKIMKEYRTPQKWGDQAYLEKFLSNAPRWDKNIQNYKHQIRPKGCYSQGTDIVIFHGKPRPWTAGELKCCK